MNAHSPSDGAANEGFSDSDFPDTDPLARDISPEALSLIAGDLGDASYRIDNFAESLNWVRQICDSRQVVTVVIVNQRPGDPPDVVVNSTARINDANETLQTMELDLPHDAPFVGRGLTLRGSVRVQGVIVTFECETLDTERGENGRPSVLTVRLPFRLYRLQRRDSFRVPVPTSMGILITLKSGFRHLENLRALDLSCGGMAVLVRAPLEAVHMGKRFTGATVKLGPHATHDVFKVDMLVRHVRMAPPGLSKLLAPVPQPTKPVAPPARPGNTMFSRTASAARTVAAAGAPPSRDAALAAVGALLQPEVLQLGIEFDRMPTQLERNLVRLVNELGVNLVTRVRDDQ